LIPADRRRRLLDRYEGNIRSMNRESPTSFQPQITFGRLQEIDPRTRCCASAINAMSYAGQVPTTYNSTPAVQKKLP